MFVERKTDTYEYALRGVSNHRKREAAATAVRLASGGRDIGDALVLYVPRVHPTLIGKSFVRPMLLTSPNFLHFFSVQGRKRGGVTKQTHL